MESFLQLARARYSCRVYLDKPVPVDLLEKVLEAVRVAPSAVNFQPWYFVLITNEELKKKIITCYSRPWIESAPVIIVACGDHSRSWRRGDGKDHCDIDLAIAIDHLTLSAADNGLATCWVCKFDAMRCSSILNLPAQVSPIALIPIGFPADKPDSERHEQKRKMLNEIIRWNEFTL